MAARLRYLGHNLEVPDGEFVIGRSSKCQLSIDDPLISRRHAILRVLGDRARVEDLGSRNGVLVNGQRVDGHRDLTEGDTITVGGQAMTIHGLKAAANEPFSAAPRTRAAPELQTISGLEMLDEPSDLSEHTAIRGSPIFQRDPDKRVHELSLVGAVAEKAMALGRAEDAQRLLERPLRDILERARGRTETSQRFDPASDALAAQRAANLAVRLASALSKGEWVDYVFDLFTARAELLPQPVVDELYTVLRKIRVDGSRLRDYLDVLQAQPEGSLGPTARFLVSRIEGLEPLVGLK
jgi:predicted component of type VI protein secretion system